MSKDQMIDLKLTPIRMLHPKFESPENNNYRIYACTTDSQNVLKNKYGNITIKGEMQKLELDEEYEVQIVLDTIHPTFGASYNIATAPLRNIPQTKDEQQRFLEAIITPLQVASIYEAYPDHDIIQLFIDDKFDYKIVKNFGAVVYERVKEKIMENIAYREILSRLSAYGISYNAIMKLEEIFQNRDLIIQKIEENPYYLTQVPGWGFKKADKVAKAMDIKDDNPHRIRSGIFYTLEQNELEGHTYMTKAELVKATEELLEIEPKLIHDQIIRTDTIHIRNDHVSTIRTHNAELNIAEMLKLMLDEPYELPYDPAEFIETIEKNYRGELPNGLTKEQKNLFHDFKKRRVNVLTAPAGSGKSAMQKYLLELINKLGLTYNFLSPSAKAAKVTKEYTGVDAQTIHRKLKYFEHKPMDELAEIFEDVVIMDEAGMSDVLITSSLLSRLRNPRVRILFVGDPYQISSVGCGNLLHDLIESEFIPTTFLSKVFRQEEGGIIDIATQVRQGKTFLPNDFEGGIKFGEDLYIHCTSQPYMEDAYQKYYEMFLKTYDPKEIMVLSPTKKARLGTVAINKYIQSIINPPSFSKKEHVYGEEEHVFRVNDYIMNTQNAYDLQTMEKNEIDWEDEYDTFVEEFVVSDLINGDTGEIIDIQKEDKPLSPGESHTPLTVKGIIAKFNGLKFKIGFDKVYNLLHAWSYTGHKSQGSASPAVICILDKSHKRQLTSNLVYTMLTRAKKRCVIVTQAETLNYAIKRAENKRRNTHLQEFIAEAFNGEVD